MNTAVKANITKSNEQYEVRCGICGKLLFVIKNGVDISALNVTMVARCTRNSCKIDNEISFMDIKTP